MRHEGGGGRQRERERFFHPWFIFQAVTNGQEYSNVKPVAGSYIRVSHTGSKGQRKCAIILHSLAVAVLEAQQCGFKQVLHFWMVVS